MKALGLKTFGPPSKLEILTLPDPKIESPDDIIVSVHAIGLNRSDYMRMSGWKKLLESPTLPMVIGAEFSGTIHQVGSNVTKFAPGDPVYGFSIFVHGSGSQFLHLTPYTRHYIAHIPSYSSVSPPPPNTFPDAGHSKDGKPLLSFQEAASLSVCCATSIAAMWQAEELMKESGSKDGLRGKTVLVVGGLGGVGSTAVQILKSVFGVKKVIITVSTPKLGLVDELLGGEKVDQVVDYTKEDVVKVIGERKVDFLYDTVGVGMKYINVVKKGGLILCILGKEKKTLKMEIPDAPWWICMLLDVHSWVQSWRAGRYGVVYKHTCARRDEEVEGAIEKWVGEGKLRPVVGRVIQGSEVEEVRAAVELSGKAKGTVGKVVVMIDGLVG